ncbi:MAG: diguanylate cyclase [Desulfuromonadaceae bacterium]|nr:diguanylate cyclase [Desulfuromonadaceae bacterium]
MSLRGKIIALVFLFEALLVVTAGVLLYQDQQSRINGTLALVSEGLKNRFNRNAIDLQRRYATRVEGFVRTSPQICDAMARKDRDLLRKIVHRRLETLQKEDHHFYGISFVLADGIVLYHTREDNRIGRSVAHVSFARQSLEQQVPQSSLSLALAGLAYRFSHPVFDGDTYLGMVVFVVDPSEAIVEVSQDYDAECGIFIEAGAESVLEQEKAVSLHNGFVLAPGRGELFADRTFLDQLVQLEGTKELGYNGRIYRRLEDVPLKNNQGETIARVMAVFDTTDYILDFNQQLSRSVTIFAGVFLATLLSLYALVGRLLSVEDVNRQLACKIEQEAVLQKELRTLSESDGLTGIYNRRKFEELFEVEWNAARRAGRSLAVLLFDIDFFKEYNDHYGHLAGDEALRLVAGLLKSGLARPRDVVARYGGEEFVCLLPETDGDAARHVAENLRLRVEQYGCLHEFSSVQQVITLSGGVSSVVPTQTGAKEDLIDRADKALYAAKKAGRNQVCVFGARGLKGSLSLIQ